LVQTSISFIAFSWLFFVLVYTNNPIALNYKKLLPLFIIPVLSWLVLLTNNHHHLLFISIHYAPKKPYNLAIEYGNLFWLFSLISHFYSFAGLIILYQFSKHQSEPVKKQSMILWLAPIVILLSTVTAFIYLWISKQTSPPFYGVEITPTLFTIMILIFAVAIFRYRFLDILPGVLQKVIENIDDAILIVDNNNYIASFNPSFAHFFQRFGLISINTPISAFTQTLKNHCAIDPDSTLILTAFESGISDLVEGDICLLLPEEKYFKVKIRMLTNKKKLQGRIITFTDVTEYRRLFTELSEKNT
jgi:PAS domain-containing protein